MAGDRGRRDAGGQTSASATSSGNEWNNLSLANVIFAILVIGVVE